MYQNLAGAADDAESRYQQALAQGKVTRAQFQRNCASYGITKERYGSSWDDKCMGHEYKNAIGPVFGGQRGVFQKAVESPFFVPAAIGVAGLVLYLVLR